jgi:hypothetical protein
MVDMANKANNFNSQFASPGRFSGMGQVGPNKSNMNAPTALDMGRFSGISGFGVANEPDVEQVAQLGNPSMMQNAKSKLSSSLAGLMDFAPFGKKSISGMALRGLGSLFSRNPNAPSYQTRSPNIDYSNLNTNNLNDFYDSNPESEDFGTTRFDRATTDFGKSRTLKDYFDRKKENDGGGGGGGGARSGGSSSGGTSATSSDLGGLGFSDIRLKDNVELIGKSPSNINIYKFNYKGNPTIYQGAMAHEVSWASVKANNGYLMIDYDKIDVEFKPYAK